MPEENLNQFKEEIMRHFDVVSERLEDKIVAVSEQIAVNTEQITSIKEDAGQIKDDIGIIKTDIEFIKHDLKQKISRDEFAILERRVSMLEAKR